MIFPVSDTHISLRFYPGNILLLLYHMSWFWGNESAHLRLLPRAYFNGRCGMKARQVFLLL